MVDLPEASVSIDPESGPTALGLDYLTIFAAVPSNADMKPRVFASIKALLAKHNYSRGAAYAAIHVEETRKPILFVGLPISTAGFVAQVDDSEVTGSAEIKVTAGAAGCLDECDGILTVDKGGTVGTDSLSFILSLDGGDTEVPLRLGTLTSYTHPYYGFTLTLGAGTLAVGDVFRFRTYGPKPTRTDFAAARAELAAQTKAARSWLFVDDIADEDDATAVVTQTNAYDTSDQRYVYARVQVPDRWDAARMTRKRVRAGIGASVTFAEVGASADTITRAAGSWIADGLAIGDTIVVTGAVASSGANNITGVIVNLTATVITLGTEDLTPEGPITSAIVTGHATVTFAEVGATADTITRNKGSWIDDGFKAGQTITVEGSASNDGDYEIASVTATVITLGSDDLTPEVISSRLVSITAPEQSDADSVEANDAEFADIDAQMRIDLAHGRGRKMCPITGYNMRRPAAWGASIREYQHDVQVPPWRKSDGPLLGFDLEDDDGNLVEHDERVSRDCLPARFTCFRTWANGPKGTFIAHSLTRATGKFLSRTHNVAVANIACAVVQHETETAGIGAVLESTDDNKIVETDLQGVETKVNSALSSELRQRKFEGVRASSAVWSASRTDVFDEPDTPLTGTLLLRFNRTVEKLRTLVRVQ